MLLFVRLQLLKVLWAVMIKRAKFTYDDPEEMLDVIQLQKRVANIIP